MDRKAHWDAVYARTPVGAASWYQETPRRALALLTGLGVGPATEIIDIGGGDSTLVDAVLAGALGRMTVLDVSATALARARERLGPRADDVTWIEGDVLDAALPAEGFDVWHDRAVFHFLTEPAERAAYAAIASAAVRPGGAMIVATFGADGPTRCSGLVTARYGADDLARALGEAFALEWSDVDIHRTPAGREQAFTVARFRRRARGSTA